MAEIDILAPFRNISPGQFISRYSDWILFILLIFFFWSVITISLKKRFGDSKAFRILATSTALLLSVSTYYMIYKGKLNISLEGFGMFGAMLVLIVIFFILFALQRNFNMKTKLSLPLGFVLFYLSLVRLTPNIMNDIQNVFPFAKAIMVGLFLFSLYRVIVEFIKHSKGDLKLEAQKIENIRIPPKDVPEINHELKDDKKERNLLKGKTLKLTKMEINTVDDIENLLGHLIKLIKEKGKNISQDETLQISNYLRQLSNKENILVRSMPILKRQAEIFKSKHRKDINELQKRYQEAKDNPKQQEIIKEEISFQKRMIEVLDFIETYENRIVEFTQSLNQTISKAMIKLRSIYPHECVEYLESARKSIEGMKHIFKKQKELEKYVLSLNKKTIKDLKKEKKADQS